MMVSTTEPIEREERYTWRSLFGGIGVWFLHQNIVYGLASLSCVWGRLSDRIGGATTLQMVETIITIIALLMMLYLIYLPWRDWQRFQSERPQENPQMLEETEQDRRPLIAFVTMLTNGFFLLFILGSLVPIWALEPCTPS